jgi:hypothetical protein
MVVAILQVNDCLKFVLSNELFFSCLGYIIEKCPENSDRWEKVPGVFNQPKGTVKDLETNKKYKFRVKAENIYGVSDPLETTASITVKPPYGKIITLFIPSLILFVSRST